MLGKHRIYITPVLCKDGLFALSVLVIAIIFYPLVPFSNPFFFKKWEIVKIPAGQAVQEAQSTACPPGCLEKCPWVW